MMMKKSILLTAILFLVCSLLLSQNLVEAAKKEKERRAQLKKKSAVIVTNANLYKTDKEATIRITPPEDQEIQRTTPQKVQRTTPSKPTMPSKTQPSQQIENIDQMDLSVDKLDQVDQLQARGFSTDYAIQVLNSNEFVRNPAFALDKPDGKYAELPIYGFIELEIAAKNGPGDDIAVYAQQIGSQEEMPGGEEEGGIPELSVGFQYWEGFWYGILGMEETGDWVAIGRGTGNSSPEKFDLGELHSLKKVRIMFKPHGNADLGFKVETWQTGEFFFKIDAVQSLHR